ncbi:ABCG35 [Scenedesmus sp. PABB004]|nr:ABCG35 [Scenedesmus sp. PABB004]
MQVVEPGQSGPPAEAAPLDEPDERRGAQDPAAAAGAAEPPLAAHGGEAAAAAGRDDAAAVASGGGGDGGGDTADAPGAAADAERGEPLPALRRVLSLDGAKRNNLHLLDDDTLLLAAGSVVLLLHVPTLQQRHLPSRDGGGVAAVAAHPSGQRFLVAEKRRRGAPGIYVYDRDLQLVQTLRGGTERAYSCAAFSADGAMVAGVGGAPDFQLTLWDAASGATLLRCKAFSQEVYTVAFSPHTPGSLGALGKFGSLELSDVAAVVEAPDGKVLSGSESGALLLWDGGLVKAVLRRPGGAPCHAGAVAVLLHDRASGLVLSGGDDGVLRLWELARLLDAEPADGTNNVCDVRPAAEVALPGGGAVCGALWARRAWLVASGGSLFRVALPLNLLDSRAYAPTKLLDLHGHAGGVLGLFACPDRHVVVTASGSGAIQAIAYQSNEVLQQRQFSSAATAVAVLPAAADAAQRTAVLGFADGTVRVVRRCADGWRLLAVARPHKAAVVSVAVSPDGSRLAAVASDGRAFFFGVASSTGALAPQLACALPGSGPACSCWSPDGARLLVGFSSGVAVEAAPPLAGSHKQQAQQLQELQEAQQRAQAGEPGGAAGGQALHSAQEEAELAAAAAGQPSDEAAGALPITLAAYKPGDSSRFLLWVGGQGAGQVLESCWSQAGPLSSSRVMSGAAVTAAASSCSGRYALVGSADGVVRLEGRDTSGGADGRHWQHALHDMHDGRVTGLALAYDDSCLLSAASDGTLLVLANPLEPAAAPGASPAPLDEQLPTMAQDAAAGGLPDAPDLAPAAPSLEEAKQAAQLGRQAEAAASARAALVAAVEDMRREHAALLADNAARPPGERVPEHMLQLDAGLDALVEAERQQKLADARAQVAHDAELAALQLSKLQGFFTAPAVHRLTLHSLAGSATVSTLRQADLPQALQVAIAEAEREEADQLLRRQLSKEAAVVSATGAGPSTPLDAQRAPPGAVEGSPSGASLPAAGSSAVASRAELWRHAKQQRAAEWAAFDVTRPDDDYEAPADAAALREAAASIGDFKLKTDPGHVLPEDQRMTPARKRREMLLLVRDVAAAQAGFNAQVLRLREAKRSLLPRLNALQGRLMAVSEALGEPAGPLPVLGMLPEEEPEQELTAVSDAQIAQHVAAKKAAARAGTGGGCLGGTLPGAAASSAGACPGAAEHGKPACEGAASKACAGGGGQAAWPGRDAAPAQQAAPRSPAELRQLRMERLQLLGDIEGMRSTFDASLAACRAAQLKLAPNLSAAEGQLLVMHRELAVLVASRRPSQDAEVRELVLEGKRAAKAQELAELASCLAEVGRALEAKQAEGEAASQRRAAVVGELEALLADADAFRDALAKLFQRRARSRVPQRARGPTGAAADRRRSALSRRPRRRRIKRLHRHTAGSDDDDNASGASDSGDESADDDSDDDGGEEVCPPGCDPALYERVVELRERRLGEEEEGAEVGKALEGIRKERELLTKKAKLLEQALAGATQSVMEFQQEKQGRLNQLPAIVSLRLHQVEFLADRRLPADLSSALVFSQHELSRLQRRMQELDEERSALRRQHKELQHAHAQLAADKAAKEARLAELAARCREMQLLKFGQVIDVALLDTIGVRNRGADELRDALRQQARRGAPPRRQPRSAAAQLAEPRRVSQALAGTRELADWDARIAAKRRELLALSRENTAALELTAELARAQRDLEAGVLAGRGALASDGLERRRAALAERDRLVAAIAASAAELDGLRAQLGACGARAPPPEWPRVVAARGGRSAMAGTGADILHLRATLALSGSASSRDEYSGAAKDEAEAVAEAIRRQKKEKRLKAAERTGAVAGPLAQGEEALLQRIKQRFDRCGYRLPGVEVTYADLSVVRRAVSVEDSLPGLFDPLKSLLRRRTSSSVRALDGVTGVLRPASMTLVLGPPGCGRSTLLKVLSGRLGASKMVDIVGGDSIRYNGWRRDAFVLPRTAAYVDQVEMLIPTLTCRETLAFSETCAGERAQLIDAVSKLLSWEAAHPQLAAERVPLDDEADVMMVRMMRPDNLLLTEYSLAILGLSHAADTLVGDAVLRGVSGGEKRRVAVGEGLATSAYALFLDEASTGLDSASTLALVHSMRRWAKLLNSTVVMALLQPEPAVVEAFDDILLLGEGRVLWHGPVAGAAAHFAACGLRPLPGQELAEFLQQVASPADQPALQAPPGGAFVPPAELSRRFWESQAGVELRAAAEAVDAPDAEAMAGLETRRRTTPLLVLLRCCAARMFRVDFARNWEGCVIRWALALLISVTTGTLFWQLPLTFGGGVSLLGMLFNALFFMQMLSVPTIELTHEKRPILFKERDTLWHPAWVEWLPAVLLNVPVVVVDVIIYGTPMYGGAARRAGRSSAGAPPAPRARARGPTRPRRRRLGPARRYFMAGFTCAAPPFFTFLAILFMFSLLCDNLYRVYGGAAQVMSLAMGIGVIHGIINEMLAGFVVTHGAIPKYWLWAYYINPLAYAFRALALNEFMQPRWAAAPGAAGGVGLGEAVLDMFELTPGWTWVWAGVAVLAGMAATCAGAALLAFSFGRMPESPAVLAAQKREQADEERRAAVVRGGAGGGKGAAAPAAAAVIELPAAAARDGGGAPGAARAAAPGGVSIAFADLCYYVPHPGGGKEELQLLHGVTGAFKPGVLCALMGSSGAGKSTLIDVLAQRKTHGRVTGTITVDGFPVDRVAFSRLAGYVEQADIHAPLATVSESLEFSAALRAPRGSDWRAHVAEVLEVVELAPLAQRLVGTPGVDGLSVEQRKRLTIAVELVTAPRVLFLDEPTSGLDARSAANVARVMRGISGGGVTVVATVHQPSAAIFGLFDDLLLLRRGGRVVFFGPLGPGAAGLVSYFTSLPGTPPLQEGQNPSAWMLDVVGGPAAQLPGYPDLAAAYASSALAKAAAAEAARLCDGADARGRDVPAELTPPAPASALTQLRLLHARTRRSYWRNPGTNFSRFAITLAISLVVGSMEWGKGRSDHITSARGVQNTLGALYMVASALSTEVGFSCQSGLAKERAVFVRERAAGTYGPGAFLVAQAGVAMQYVSVQVVVYVVVTYFMVGFEVAADKFFYVLALVWLACSVSFTTSQALIHVSRVVFIATTVYSVLSNLQGLVSGFTQPLPATPPAWWGAYFLNPTYYVFIGIGSEMLGGLRSTIPDPVTGAPVAVSDYVAELYGMRRDAFPGAFGAMGMLAAFASAGLAEQQWHWPSDPVFADPWVRQNVALTYGHQVQDGVGSQALRMLAVHGLASALGVRHLFRPLGCVGHIGSHVHYREAGCNFTAEADVRQLTKARRMVSLPSTVSEDDVAVWHHTFLPSLDFAPFVKAVGEALRAKRPTLYAVERVNSLVRFYPDILQAAPALRPTAPPAPLQCRPAGHDAGGVPSSNTKAWLLDALRVAIHIRRGDVITGNWHRRVLSTQYYINIAKAIAAVLEPLGCDYAMEVYIESPRTPEGEAEIVQLQQEVPNAVMLIDTDMLWSWQMMATADVVVMSNSMFSLSAALLNPNAFSIHVPYKHYINRLRRELISLPPGHETAQTGQPQAEQPELEQPGGGGGGGAGRNVSGLNLPSDPVFADPWVRQNIAVTYGHQVQDGVGSQTLRMITVYALSSALGVRHLFRPLGCVGHIGSHVHYRDTGCEFSNDADRRLLTKAQHMITLPGDTTEADVQTWDKKYLPSLDFTPFAKEVAEAAKRRRPTLFEVERLNNIIRYFPDIFLTIPSLRPANPPAPLQCRRRDQGGVPSPIVGRGRSWLLDALRVAIHIRRGDVITDNWHQRVLSTQYYINIAKAIAAVLEPLGCDYAMEVYIESPRTPEGVEEIRVLRQLIPNSVMLIDTDMLWSWQMMATADVVVMSNSMFSMSAALLNPNAIGIHVPYKHYINRVGMFRLRHWHTPVNDNGTLPVAAINELQSRAGFPAVT